MIGQKEKGGERIRRPLNLTVAPNIFRANHHGSTFVEEKMVQLVREREALSPQSLRGIECYQIKIFVLDGQNEATVRLLLAHIPQRQSLFPYIGAYRNNSYTAVFALERGNMRSNSSTQ